MQWLLRIVCLGYMAFMTLLLLAANPASWIGVQGDLPWLLQKLLPVAHLLSFLVLTMLALWVRWPAPRWGIVLILVIYGGVMECIQGFVPSRTPEWADWLQDIGGVAIGVAICWGIVALFHMMVERWQASHQLPSTSSHEWAVLRKVLQRPRVSKASWWN